jgi:hypothetical protein
LIARRVAVGYTTGVCASAMINGDTRIGFLTCRDGSTEFTFDEQDLMLYVSERGLYLLADVVNAAVEDRRSKKDGQA